MPKRKHERPQFFSSGSGALAVAIPHDEAGPKCDLQMFCALVIESLTKDHGPCHQMSPVAVAWCGDLGMTDMDALC